MAKKLSEILEQKIKITSALAIAGIASFLKNNPAQKNSAIISGGNV